MPGAAGPHRPKLALLGSRADDEGAAKGATAMSVPARLAAITAAAIVLAACSHAAAPVIGRTAIPPTCRQQYEAWKHGPALAAANQLKAALARVEAAARAQDVPRMVAAFRGLRPAATALASQPPPRCADPAGDYALVIARIRAAADHAGAGTGLGSLLLALEPLRGLPAIEAKLSAELKRTTGA